MNMHSCHCLPADTRERLAADAHAPSLAVCAGCCRLDLDQPAYEDWPSERRFFGFLTRLPSLPGMPGQTLGDAVANSRNPRLMIHPPLPDAPDNRRLTIDGGAVGEIFVLRATADGEVLLFPGDAKPWHQRVIQPDDRAVGFRMDLPDASEVANRERTFWHILRDGVGREGKLLRVRPGLVFRLA